MMNVKIAITVEGGCITGVWSNLPANWPVEIEIVDFDDLASLDFETDDDAFEKATAGMTQAY